VHVDLLTGRVWLVPTFKTATSATAARNFVSSVFRRGDVGLQDVLVSDRDTRFTSTFSTDPVTCTPRWAPRSSSAPLTTTTPRLHEQGRAR
jgi:hypothetical protein